MTIKTFENAIRKLTITDVEFDENRELVDIEVPVSKALYRNEHGTLCMTGERGVYVLDYYGEFNDGYPWVWGYIETLEKKHGVYHEWEHPGAIAFYAK